MRRVHKQFIDEKNGKKENIYCFSISCIYSPFYPGGSLYHVKKVWNSGLLIGGILSNRKLFLMIFKKRVLLEKFIEFEELHLLDEMVKEYPETHLQKLCMGIHNETIQLIKMYNGDSIHMILQFSNKF
ncbi:hypothetical protein RND81_O344500 [Saponaria officinalis]|uniref:Uncharacterized protein n=1 Tax=Saponaria officinalis TaxID=3572 RepID=A0AAW1GGU7_SAPOF